MSEDQDLGATTQYLQTLWQEASQTADTAIAELPEMTRRADAHLKGKERQAPSSNAIVEAYDPAAESFPAYVRRNNEAIVQRYAQTIHQLLIARPDLITDDRAFYEAINPGKRPVDPPLSLDEQQQLVQRLDQLALGEVGGKPLAFEPAKLRTEIAQGGERVFGANYNLRGTGKPSEAVGRPTLRKIYLSPDIRGIDRFTQKLYEALDQKGVRIYGAKVHTDDFDTDASKAVVSQAHNTMVLYVENDLETQQVIQTIIEAEKQSGVTLATYTDDEVFKTVLIEGKMMVGVDEATAQLSFDTIANSLANKGRRIWKDGKVPTVEEVRVEMESELKIRNGKKPDEYLSLSTTAQAEAQTEPVAQGEEEAVEIEALKNRLASSGGL